MTEDRQVKDFLFNEGSRGPATHSAGPAGASRTISAGGFGGMAEISPTVHGKPLIPLITEQTETRRGGRIAPTSHQLRTFPQNSAVCMSS